MLLEYFRKYPEEYEEKIFWIFVHIMYEKNWRAVFKSGTPKVIEMNKYFEKILKEQVPDVYKKINESNVIQSVRTYNNLSCVIADSRFSF